METGHFILFTLSVPCSDHACDLHVGYGTMLIARYRLFVEKGIPPPRGILANVCFIISVLPVLKLTFKYLGETSGS